MASQMPQLARRSIVLFGVLFCLVVLVPFLVWRWKTSDERQAEEEARRGLVILSHVVNSENSAEYGFASASEVQNMSLGKGVAVSSVSADDLVDFNKAKTSLPEVIKNQDVRIYPVMVNGKGRVLIKVRKFDGNWRLASFGEGDVARNLVQFQTGHNSLLALFQEEQALEVPAMNVYFMEGKQRSANSPKTLTPLTDVGVFQAMPVFRKEDFLKKHPEFNSQSAEGVGTQDILETLAAEMKDMTSPPPTSGETDKPLAPDVEPKPEVHDHPRIKEIAKYSSFRCPPGTRVARPAHESGLAANDSSLRTHEVRPGECLTRIAQHYYHKPTWRPIYNANKASIRCGPNLIFPGQTLVIP